MIFSSLRSSKARLLLIAFTLANLTAFAWLQYRSCSDLVCLKKKNTWLAERYDDSVPLYISAKYLERLLPADLDKEKRAAVSDMLRSLLAPAHKSEKEWTKNHPVTCAVVGSSGNLKYSNYGEAIDSHSLVFRMNNAPIRNYEKDVGKRITHHMLSSHMGRYAEYPRDVVTVLALDDTMNFGTLVYNDREQYDEKLRKTLYWLTGTVFPERFPPTEFPLERKANYFKAPGGVKLLTPDFISYIRRNWFVVDNLTGRQFPSMGFKTIVLALHICDQVDLFGFGINEKTQQWDHYFDEGFPLSNVTTHRPDYQTQFIEELEERGIVRVFKGNVEREGVEPPKPQEASPTDEKSAK